MTADEAGRAATAYLASLWNGTLPPEIFSAGDCKSRCVELTAEHSIGCRLEAVPIEPCHAWTCPFSYGDPSLFGQHLGFDVVVEHGTTPRTQGLDLEACSKKPHRCRLDLTASNALWLADSGDVQALVWLRWDPEHDDLHWEVEVLGDPVQVLRFSCHDQ